MTIHTATGRYLTVGLELHEDDIPPVRYVAIPKQLMLHWSDEGAGWSMRVWTVAGIEQGTTDVIAMESGGSMIDTPPWIAELIAMYEPKDLGSKNPGHNPGPAELTSGSLDFFKNRLTQPGPWCMMEHVSKERRREPKMTSTAKYAATRQHVSPDGDEHAAMCWIRKAGFDTETEARAALLDLMLEEIDRDGMKGAVKEIALGATAALTGKIRWTITSY